METKNIKRVEVTKKKDWGGAREGSGAKQKYNEKTTTIAFRVPISKVDEVKQIIKNKQTQWKNKI